MKNKLKRIVSMLLCAMLFLSLLPLAVGAGETGGENEIYANNFIPFNEMTDLIPTEGNDCLVNLDSHLYPDESDVENGITWAGARLTYADTRPGARSRFAVCYQEYCRRNSIEQLYGDQTQYVVLKVRMDDSLDVTIDMGGRAHYRFATDEATWNYVSLSGSPYYGATPMVGNGTDGMRYFVYDTSDGIDADWEIQRIDFTLVNRDLKENEEIYVEEIAFFSESEEVYAYTGLTHDDVRFNEDLLPAPDYDYTNARIPINVGTGVIPLTGYYGTYQISDYMYPYEYDNDPWEGARLKLIEETDPGNLNGSGWACIRYDAFCYDNGIEPLPIDQTRYVVLAYRADGEVDDVKMTAVAYSTEGWEEVAVPTEAVTDTALSGDGTGDVQYLVFEVGQWEHESYKMTEEDYLSYLKVQIDGLEEDDVLYLYELSLFATEAEMCAYTGLPYDEPSTEPDTDPETEPDVKPETEPDTEPVTDVVPDENHGGSEPETESDRDSETTAPDEGTSDVLTTASEPDESHGEGCSSAIGLGAVAVLTAMAAVAALKRRGD